MRRICPNPMPWHHAFERLNNYAQSNPCTPPLPPKPFILAGWVYTNDLEKMERWEKMIAWAEKNGCTNLLADIPEKDFYFVEKPSAFTMGPLGGSKYQAWDFKIKNRPSPEQIEKLMDILLTQWSQIVGAEIGTYTHPLAFTGEKARRLLVYADAASTPPWGGWSYLSTKESERRTFTRFRAVINKAISPHEVDHIDFITEDRAEPAHPSGLLRGSSR